MRNYSYENNFELHENETASRTHFHMKGFVLRVPFKTEAQQNSEMAYSHCHMPARNHGSCTDHPGLNAVINTATIHDSLLVCPIEGMGYSAFSLIFKSDIF